MKPKPKKKLKKTKSNPKDNELKYEIKEM